jgi:hypothetical protein
MKHSGILQQRRDQGCVCHKCKSPDYRMEPPYEGGTKPNFVCNQCGTSWQYGVDGGKFEKLLNDIRS